MANNSSTQPEQTRRVVDLLAARRDEILNDKSYIDDVLARGAKRANEIADKVMGRVRQTVGLR